MSKLKLTQAEIDKLVVVERVEVDPTVLGVGFNDTPFSVWVGGKVVWQYKLWLNMLKRCFCEKSNIRYPAYKDVNCCDEWLSFGRFLEWCNKEVGYGGKRVGCHLDKDLIISGNKIYRPEGCSFVPAAINNLLTDRGNARGVYPVGVYYYKRDGEFRAQLCYDGRQKCLGYYKTPEDAFAAYKIAKEAQIKVVALQHQSVLKPAVFDSLMNWEINIGD